MIPSQVIGQTIIYTKQLKSKKGIEKRMGLSIFKSFSVELLKLINRHKRKRHRNISEIFIRLQQ